MPRFIPNKKSESKDSNGKLQEAWEILDTSNGEFRLPRQAVTLYVGKDSAYKIAEILNKEWIDFLNNPT